MSNDRDQEIREAINAGEYARSCLYDAREKLKSAGNWGLLDMFGGGFISSMMKHSRMDEAKRSMTEAQNALNSFRKEIQDVDNIQTGFDIGGFLSFADIFFDDLLVDLLMQKRISKAKEQVDEAIDRVEDMLRKLRQVQGR